MLLVIFYYLYFIKNLYNFAFNIRNGIKVSCLFDFGFVLSQTILDLWINMMTTKYEITKFGGENDYSSWCVRIRALLLQQRLLKTLQDKEIFPATLS